MQCTDINTLAAALERAWAEAFPGRETAERNALLCARHSTRLTRAFANRRCTMSEVSLPHCVQCRQPGYACIVRGRTVC